MKLRIGTRRSRLAMAQAEEVSGRLRTLGHEPELVPMTTSGDRGASPLDAQAGLKGLFVAEIVRALQDEEIDLAVHSAKDLPAEDPEDVVVAAVPERASAFDVLVTREDGELLDGAVVGTSSLRRQAQLRRARPTLKVADLRGNVDTRLRKLDEGEVDAVVLASAGLARLGITPAHFETLGIEEMVPAPGQGALALQARAGDGGTLEALEALDHPPSRWAFEAERRLMDLVGGGCALPLGAHATAAETGVYLVSIVASPDGSALVREAVEAPTPDEAADRAARGLFAAGAREILEEARAR